MNFLSIIGLWLLGQGDAFVGQSRAADGVELNTHQLVLHHPCLTSDVSGRVQLSTVPLAIIKAERMADEYLIAGNSQLGGRIEATREENNGFWEHHYTPHGHNCGFKSTESFNL